MPSGTQRCPPVTAIIVNFNGGPRTLRCIDALTHQAHPVRDIVVVDNASTDGSVEEIGAKFPEIGILRQAENLGLSKARNIGLHFAKTPLVLSVDSDVYLRPDALGSMLAARAASGAAVVCPRIILYPDRTIIQCEGADPHYTGTFSLRNAYSTDLTDARGPVPVGGATGSCLLLDRSAALEAGGFNELYFFYHEDLEFSLRMRALGHDIVCAPAAIVDHDQGEGTPGLSFRGRGEYPAHRAYLSMRNRLITIGIHYRLRSIMILLPPLLLYEVGTFGMAIVRGWFPQYWRAWSDLIAERHVVMAHRRVMRTKRTRSDRELFTADDLAFGPGVMRRGPERMIATLIVWLMRAYWRLARPFLGH